MPLRSSGRQISFEILAGDTSGDGDGGGGGGGGGDSSRRKRRARGSRKRKKPTPVAEEPSAASPIGSENALRGEEIGFKVLESRSVVETVREGGAVVVESSQVSSVAYVELRQRNVNGGGCVGDEVGDDDAAAIARESSAGSWRPESNGSVTNLAKEKSLDWNQVIAEDPNILGEVSSSAKSPFAYFVGEIYSGNALRSTIAVGNEKKRQRVYNTMFHVPWRCERLIIAGFFVCLDSFLSLLTIMPARILMTIWRVLKTRQFQRPNAAELSDFGCLIVLALGAVSLQKIDISLIYHIIRGQGTIKLYVIYNVLEIFDKLCQSFGEDVLQVLFNSAEGLSNCLPDTFTFELMRFILDETIAVIAFVVHAFVLLVQAITLATCIIAHNNALLALLVSNNFAEIKSNVFKRVSKENTIWYTMGYPKLTSSRSKAGVSILTYMLFGGFIVKEEKARAKSSGLGPWLEVLI